MSISSKVLTTVGLGVATLCTTGFSGLLFVMADIASVVCLKPLFATIGTISGATSLFLGYQTVCSLRKSRCR